MVVGVACGTSCPHLGILACVALTQRFSQLVKNQSCRSAITRARGYLPPEVHSGPEDMTPAVLPTEHSSGGHRTDAPSSVELDPKEQALVLEKLEGSCVYQHFHAVALSP
jgi:hypothetical protein